MQRCKSRAELSYNHSMLSCSSRKLPAPVYLAQLQHCLTGMCLTLGCTAEASSLLAPSCHSHSVLLLDVVVIVAAHLCEGSFISPGKWPYS